VLGCSVLESRRRGA